MSEQPKTLPTGPKEVMVKIIAELRVVSIFSDEYIADRILEAFEDNDIDVTWRPVEHAVNDE